MGASLEAKATVHSTDEEFAARLTAAAPDMRFAFIVSEFEVAGAAEEAAAAPFSEKAEVAGAGEVTVGVARAAGSKCARCWNYSTRLGEARGHRA